MIIQLGEKIPDVELKIMGKERPESVRTGEASRLMEALMRTDGLDPILRTIDPVMGTVRQAPRREIEQQ